MALASAAGDEDEWMLIERVSDDGYPLVARTRINAAISEFSSHNVVSALICDVLPNLVLDNGFPACHQELYDLEDRLVAAVAGSGIIYHTASVTGDGRRVIYLAHHVGAAIEQAIAPVASEVATVSVRSDIDFVVYDEFVTPTVLDRQSDGDRQVIANLAQSGDDGSCSRKIDFWFYGPRENLERALTQLAGEGFTLDHWIDEPEGMVLTRDGSATFDSFREWTPQLVACAEGFGVEYDGWETLIVAEQSGAPEAPESQYKQTLLGKLLGKRKH